jgi:periplasmic divalent cation tolerance protein
MPTSLIYVTAADFDEACQIGATLVDERLVACANILPGMRSIYWWGGAVQEADEVVLTAKTRDDLVPAVIERVKDLHSYECPCVVALPLVDGNADFLSWVAAETRGGAGADRSQQ